MNQATEFYSPMAAEYDQVFEFGRRLDSALVFVHALRSRLGSIESAADTACGTGVYALALAETGVRVVGADISPAMIEQAGKNSVRLGLSIDWRVQPMQEPIDEESFDLLLCMGNSLPHILNAADLQRTLVNFFKALKPGGTAVIHLLNYQRILHRHERLVGVSRSSEEREFIRFYDFPEGKSTIVFNLLTVDWRGWEPGLEADASLQSVELHPYTGHELQTALGNGGFESVEIFGGLDFRPFQALDSETLLLTARRRPFMHVDEQ